MQIEKMASFSHLKSLIKVEGAYAKDIMARIGATKAISYKSKAISSRMIKVDFGIG